MEVTNGLLTNLVQTKSIERVLAPIASQVSLLIILDESGDSVGKPNHMGPCAQAVMKAAENLIAIGKERAQNSPDQDYQKQMISACEILDLASSSLYIASQRLGSDTSREVRSKVVNAAKDVLQGTMKVLLVSDDAEIRKVVSSARLVTECLTRLTSVRSMPDLLTNFKGFTDAAALLCTLAQKRQQELCHNRQREKIITALSLLKKSIPSMSVALQSYIKYPQNLQAQLGKSFVINQSQSAVSDIMEAVENKFTDEDYLDVEEPGYFVTKVDKILEALSEENRYNLDADIEIWTENIVRHSMLVAHLCLDDYRNIIVRTSQRVLQLKTRVLLLNATLLTNPELQSVKEDYDECCENFIDEFCEMEKDVNLALLNLVVDVFKETTEPLERLVKAAMYSNQDEGFEKQSKKLVVEFQTHADKMGQIASFAAASSTDAQRVRTIRRCVCHMERLDPDIVPAVVAMSTKPQDKMAVRHVKLLMKEWSFELTSLMEILDEMTDPKIFMQVSETRIEEDISACHGFLIDSDVDRLSITIKSLIGRSRRVTQMAERIINRHHDPLFRNGLLVYVKQLQKGLRAASSNVASDCKNKVYTETLQRRLQQVLDRVKQVKAGLSEESHPDILSPQRKNLRHTAMSNLSQKTSKSSLVNQTSQSISNLRENQFLPTATSSMDFLDGISVEKKKQKVRGNDEKVRDKEHVLVDAPVKHEDIQQIITNGNFLGTPSHSKEITNNKYQQELMKFIKMRNKQKCNALCGDILGWTNHIVDMAKNIEQYYTGNKKSTMQSLCQETDSLVSEVIEGSKLVLQGDVEQEGTLAVTCQQWATKIEKLRVCVDASIDKYKMMPDALSDAFSNHDRILTKEELDCLKTHNQCICDILTILENLQTKHINHKLVTRLQELKEELENITITITTTVEMSSKSVTEEEKTQLDQLGREWAVTVFCIISDLDIISSYVFELGKERKVWSCQEVSSLSNQAVISHVENENIRLKSLLHASCLGEEEKALEAQELCESMTDLLENLKAGSLHRKTTSQRGFLITKSYIPLRITILISCWVIKAVSCTDLVHKQVSVYLKPVNSLTDLVMNARTMPSGKMRQAHFSEIQLEVSRFSEKLMKLRQKVQSGIQLSTNIDRRAAVRRCLDELTESSPKLIQLIKLMTNEDKAVTELMEDLNREKLKWSSKMRELMVNLSQMKDIRTTLVSDIHSMIGVSDEPPVVTCQDETDDISLADNYHPSGMLQSKSSPLSHLKPTKTGFSSVHDELLQFTRERDKETAVGIFPTKTRKNNVESPYKPSSSILDAAKYLQKEAEKWEDDCNPIVQVAKQMSLQMQQLAEHCRGQGPISSHQDVISVALAIAENSNKMKRFADVLAKHCIDQRFGRDLQFYADQIPALGKQLTILANVQMGSTEDNRADRILVQNASNLMTSVMHAMRAAESVCVKGLLPPESGENEEVCAIILATQWKRKLVHYRKMEAKEAETDELGLRRIEEHRPPMLTQIFSAD